MALWLVRAGSHGEHEQKFLDDNRVYLTWDGVDNDLSKVKTFEGVKEILIEKFSDLSKNGIRVSANLDIFQ